MKKDGIENITSQELKNEILKSYSDPNLNFEKICAKLYVSYSYARRLFKAIENDTMVNYLKKVRLERARKLLKYTGYSTKEISIMCGFSNYNYFLRQFRSYYGKTPKEIKRNS